MNAIVIYRRIFRTSRTIDFSSLLKNFDAFTASRERLKAEAGPLLDQQLERDEGQVELKSEGVTLKQTLNEEGE
ncbi:hypothetical protein DJ030_09745 [bacterium endosymbiont of Escarpia laminata]|nr:MAG: hypothetical protein DJ030_09745 [bacterium endosymbiont of Escarpia laminata]